MKPYLVKRAPERIGRPVLDRQTRALIGAVTQHHHDSYWYWHELDEDGVECFDASGREATMDDAAGALHDAWTFEQSKKTS